MPDSFAITCPVHETVLIPSPVQPTMLMCPDTTCATIISVPVPNGALPPPLTYLEQGVAERHEMVRVHEAGGFSRTEAMQILCTTITVSIMKDRGAG